MPLDTCEIEQILDDNGIDPDAVSTPALNAIGELLAVTPTSAHDALLTFAPGEYLDAAAYGQNLLDEFTARYVGTYDAETQAVDAYITKRWIEPVQGTAAAALVDDLVERLDTQAVHYEMFEAENAPYLTLTGQRVHVFATGKAPNPLGRSLPAVIITAQPAQMAA